MARIMASTTSAGLMQKQMPGLASPRNFSKAARLPAFQSRSLQQGQRRIIARASGGGDVDFDSLLSEIADKFEKSDNKAAIIGYSFAALFALWFSEWFIHLPVLNFIFGGSIQLLGLLLLPYFSVKYLVDNDSITGDASKALDRVVKKLPGLDK